MLDQQMAFYHYQHSSLSLHVLEVFRYTLLQVLCKESSSSCGVTSGRLSPLWLYGSFWKLGFPRYTMMKTLTLWIRLSLFGSYWYIRLKVIMTVIRVLEKQQIGKKENSTSLVVYSYHVGCMCWCQVELRTTSLVVPVTSAVLRANNMSKHGGGNI